jgi:hypothetical protein
MDPENLPIGLLELLASSTLLLITYSRREALAIGPNMTEAQANEHQLCFIPACLTQYERTTVPTSHAVGLYPTRRGEI